MIPQEMTDSSPRANRTSLDMGLERNTSVTMLVLEPSATVPLCACSHRASGRLPSVRKRPSGRYLVRRWDSAESQTLSCGEMAVKRMLRLEFSLHACCASCG